MPLSETLLIYMAMLGVGMLAAALFRTLPIPYTVLLVLIGIGLGSLSRISPLLEPLQHFRLTPELVLFVFLPTLIFESGFNLNARQLVKDIAPVLTLAVPALLLSTLLIGLCLWLLLPVAPITALLFGALISATDPVAVIALFKELGAPLRLTVLVEGESLLNDATAIVVFNILLGLALYGEPVWLDAGRALARFLEVFIGGALVGIGFGLVVSWLMARLVRGSAMVLILSLIMAYSGFIISEHWLHLSGVMTVMAAALTLGVIGLPRLAHDTGTELAETWDFLAVICNTLLFLLVGLSVDLGGLLSRIDAIALAVLVVLAVRAVLVYSLVPLTTRWFKLPRVSAGERHIMSWGGLKGGLAIAIALSIPAELAGRPLLLDLTLGVVLFTLLVNAPTIRPLIRWLGIDRLSAVEQAELKRAARHASTRAERLLKRLHSAGILSPASRAQAGKTLCAALEQSGDPIAPTQHLSREWADALRAELAALEELYQANIIPQYTFLDLRGALQRQREQRVAGQAPEASQRQPPASPFVRLENALVHWLREKDWAAALLARYQNTRLSQHLLKDIAQMLMTEAARNRLRQRRQEIAPEHLQQIDHFYHQRMADLQAALAQVRHEFPDFYQRFECGLALRAALAQAAREISQEAHAGGIGAKPATLMQQRIGRALEQVPALTVSIPTPRLHDLVAKVPLFAQLPAAALHDVAARVRLVRFLTADIIIGEGERGDALYIVAQGRVEISRRGAQGRRRAINHLDSGDFFGEAALLGDQVRTASVLALQPCTLLRLTRRDVLAIADRHPPVAQRLQQAERAHREETRRFAEGSGSGAP